MLFSFSSLSTEGVVPHVCIYVGIYIATSGHVCEDVYKWMPTHIKGTYIYIYIYIYNAGYHTCAR